MLAVKQRVLNPVTPSPDVDLRGISQKERSAFLCLRIQNHKELISFFSQEMLLLQFPSFWTCSSSVEFVACLNPSNHSGHYTVHTTNLKSSAFCSHDVCTCSHDKQRYIGDWNIINKLIFLMETQCVFCSVTIIWRLILKKYDQCVWTEFIRFRARTSDGFFRTRQFLSRWETTSFSRRTGLWGVT